MNIIFKIKTDAGQLIGLMTVPAKDFMPSCEEIKALRK